MEIDGSFHLTYCTNIHPGNGWEEVFANLRQYAPALKERLSPDAPFGIGLRLSARESEELLEGDRLHRFRAFLQEHGLYVALINGFPFGSFHKRVIKDDVFAPDWRDEERVRYTLRLVEILKRLLPEGLDGGISTSPLSYKRWAGAGDPAASERLTRNIVRVAEALVRTRQETGKRIHLDIEPEPDGLIENSAETIAFFQDWLLPAGAPLLADALGVSAEEARGHLLDHVQVCFDTCHFAVEYEGIETALDRFARAGIQIGRVQISSALKVPLPPDEPGRAQLARQLEPFAESTYLHQVIEQGNDGALRRYPDLAQALPALSETEASEWRIHFHVPLFVGEYGRFGSTQAEILPLFRLLPHRPFTRHLEIETYTWDVLPPSLKQDLLESIHREYRWVLDAFHGAFAEEIERTLAGDGASGPDLTLALDKILGHFDCAVGTLHRLDQASGMLQLAAQRGIPDAVLRQVQTVPIGKGMAGLAAQRREPVQVCNLQSDTSGAARPGAKETRMEGSVAVPLLVGGTLRGVLVRREARRLELSRVDPAAPADRERDRGASPA